MSDFYSLIDEQVANLARFFRKHKVSCNCNERQDKDDGRTPCGTIICNRKVFRLGRVQCVPDELNIAPFAERYHRAHLKKDVAIGAVQIATV